MPLRLGFRIFLRWHASELQVEVPSTHCPITIILAIDGTVPYDPAAVRIEISTNNIFKHQCILDFRRLSSFSMGVLAMDLCEINWRLEPKLKT